MNFFEYTGIAFWIYALAKAALALNRMACEKRKWERYQRYKHSNVQVDNSEIAESALENPQN